MNERVRIMDKLVVTRSSFDSPQVFVRSARANGCRLSDPRTTFPLFLSLGQLPPPSGRLARAQGERQREREQPFARFPNSMGTRKRVFERFAGVGRRGRELLVWWMAGGRTGREISFTVQPV